MSDSLFRWRAFFQRSRDPLFLLNRQRRLLFANRAWNELTGLDAAEYRGRVCRRTRHPEPGTWEAVAAALAPPPEVLAGQASKTRRAFAGRAARGWWEVDFLPWRDEQGLLGILGKIAVVGGPAHAAGTTLPDKLHELRVRAAQHYRLDHLDSSMPAQQRVAEQVRLAAQTLAPVLVLGEAGTGKQHLARLIHHHGTHRERTFAAVDCPGLPPAALAGVLFGPGGLTRRGSVGTLYFRRPDTLPREVQAQLVDWLAEPIPARPRVVAGLTADPAAAMRGGRLLDELHCALAVMTIALPPLRERQADLPLLTELLLDRARGDGARRVAGLSPECWEVVRGHTWPGNLRELAAVLAAAQAHATGDRLEPADLPAYVRRAVQLDQLAAPEPARPLPLKQLLEQIERRLITLALKSSRGNKSEAAKMLTIWRPLLLRRMQALGIPDPSPQRPGKAPPP
ncbi:MAG: sigma 54-interacting transcriptional regulator [Planctomycetia bacterium]|nr:sigma 54-interacting transcriptional regulator [Planctomycetia bacterium]